MPRVDGVPMPLGRHFCPVCDGYGYVNRRVITAPTAEFTRRTEECEYCTGLGYA